MTHKYSWYVYWVSALTTLGGFMFGFDTGIISGVITMTPFMKFYGIAPNDTNLSGNIASILQLGGLVGALTQPFFNDRFGRKWTILYGSLIFIIGVILQSAAVNIAMLFVGRCIGGYALATIAVAVQMYNAEVSPKEVRGKVVGIQQVMAAFGIAVAYWMNYAMNLTFVTWGSRACYILPFALQAVPTVMLAIGIVFVPKSPRWLATKGRWEEAAISLSKFRQVPPDDPLVQRELNEIRVFMEETQAKGTWREVFSAQNVPRLMVGLPFILFQQFTGQNMIFYFAPTVFKSAGLTTSYGLLATGVVGLVKLFSSCIGIFLPDRFGRRPIMLSGTAIMVVAFLYMGIYARVAPGAPLNAATWVWIVMVFVFMFGYAYSWGVIHYVLPSEIFPNAIRAKCQLLSASIDWTFQFVSIRITPNTLAALGANTYIVWGCFNIFFMLWIYFFVPETARRSLEQIDEAFKQSRTIGSWLIKSHPKTAEADREYDLAADRAVEDREFGKDSTPSSEEEAKMSVEQREVSDRKDVEGTDYYRNPAV